MKLRANLTVNLGLRYDVDAPRHEALNRTSELSLTAPDAAAGGHPGALVFGTNCNCNTAWADTWYKDISPRVGFAYVLPGTNDKAVLRGGGAIIYGPLQYNDFGGAMDAGYNQSRDFFAVQTPYNGRSVHSGVPAGLQFALLIRPIPPSAFRMSAMLQVWIRPNSLPWRSRELYCSRRRSDPAKNGRPSMTSNWSLQLQDELAQDLIFTLGYIGQVAQNLRSGDLSNINNISPSTISPWAIV